ncbi:hypothetical protein NE236_03210 [Actinoallomurus purpureus]|uniref:hypothetical protein n=1 Tax=Actinoallomurus purpureus TaxID=478114 RepID=UPI0020938671|nr:hypothetical protein [Actinoallomurus purpureus]MCO6003979.1 hypothetical protein [Actinoallomurus purpureus]
MLDDELAVVPEADASLRHVRFGRGQAELTTRAYAGHVALFLRWCARTGREWRTAAAELALFVTFLKYGSKETTGIDWPSGAGLVLAGPNAEQARKEARIENVLTGVRQFLCHGITAKTVPPEVLAQLYEVAAAGWELPPEARGTGIGVPDEGPTPGPIRRRMQVQGAAGDPGVPRRRVPNPPGGEATDHRIQCATPRRAT